MTKPEVFLVQRAVVMGGVQTALRTLMESRLAETFDFALLQPAAARARLRRDRRQVVIFQDACAWRELPALARFRAGGVRLIIHELHYSPGSERYNVPSLLRFRTMLRLAYGVAHHVVAIAAAQVEWMRAHRLTAPPRLRLIRLASPLDTLLAVAPRMPGRPLTLAAFGRFARQKGFDTMLAAMRLLPRGRVRLRIAGAGPDESRLRELALGLDDVEFCGSIIDIPGFLSECDAVLIPSRWEPWGLVCQEAKAAGKPVISSRVDGLTEQVEEAGGCGLLVEPDDAEGLAAAIEKLAALPDETLRAWGERGRGAVATATETFLSEWEALLRELTQ